MANPLFCKDCANFEARTQICARTTIPPALDLVTGVMLPAGSYRFEARYERSEDKTPQGIALCGPKALFFVQKV